MLPPLSLSPSTSPRRSHAETALYISAHKKRCRRRDWMEGNGLAAALPAREVGRASRTAGLAGCGVGGMDMGPSKKKQGTNETSAWLACEGRKGSGRRKLQRSPAELLRGLGRHSGSRQQPAAIGVPETNRRARDLRNKQPANQGRDRTTRQAPRFPARERERELIAFPVPAAPRAFPPSDSFSPAHPRPVCGWVCVGTTGSGRRYSRSARGRGGEGG